MIYDTIISTGTTTISGCSSAELGTDTYSSLNNDVLGSTDVFTYNRSISSGQREIQLGVNAQTLLQEIPITGQATNEIIYQIKTGDFFTKTAWFTGFDTDRKHQHSIYNKLNTTLTWMYVSKSPLLNTHTIIPNHIQSHPITFVMECYGTLWDIVGHYGM